MVRIIVRDTVRGMLKITKKGTLNGMVRIIVMGYGEKYIIGYGGNCIY